MRKTKKGMCGDSVKISRCDSLCMMLLMLLVIVSLSIHGVVAPYTTTTTTTTEAPSLLDNVNIPGAATTGAVLGGVATTAAFPPQPSFPPSGFPQPGAVALGGGAIVGGLVAGTALATEVQSLVAGLPGITPISYYSNIDSTWAIPRTLPATGVVFKDVGTPLRRISLHRRQGYGRKPERSIFDKLGITCLSTRIIHPWRTLLKQLFGNKNGGSLSTDCAALPQCVADGGLEQRVIDRELPGGLPVQNMVELDDPSQINMASRCIPGMKEPSYGFRVRVMLVDDADCDDPQYASICDEEEANSKIVDCPEPSYNDPDPHCEDPFKACFGCEHSPSQSHYDSYHHPYGYDSYGNSIFARQDRQDDDAYETTQPSRRVVRRGRRRRLRVDRASQRRRASYGSQLLFANKEQYASNEDIDAFRYRF